ncbi:unnamed protein product [Ilex paraguariensis]|uniref:GDSL esterase/lipase n=1 Tax=Ilex paraguariensis TaxID=185542 RepID=A0ABC8UM15_9AQUA
MACGCNVWCIVSTVLLLFLNLKPLICGESQVPCYFIFGDSLVDNGNNNDLLTQARANFPPYGIDFPDGPTGRFTNCRNMADILAELLGFDDYIPPFATARGQDILKGVNYGSESVGIRDETGQQLGARISLNAQLSNHKITIRHIATLLGSKALAKEYLSSCLYTVGMGNNDYLNIYFMPQFYPTSSLYTPKQYAKVLVKQYSQQLKTLYKYGARKIAVFGAGRLGCIPEALTTYGTNESSCVEMMNSAAQLFNDKLELLVDDLKNKLTDVEFSYIYASGSSSQVSPSNDFTVADGPCCNVSTTMGKGQCIPQQVPCSNRDEYIYFDGYHPTEAANILIATIAYNAMSGLLPCGTSCSSSHGEKSDLHSISLSTTRAKFVAQ